MNVELVRRRFLRNLIFAVWVALSILLVSSGGPFGISEERVDAQTTTVNFVSNLVVGDRDGIGPAGVGNLPDSTTNPMMVANAGQESASGFTTGGGSSVYTITEVRAELLQYEGSMVYPFSPVLTLHADESGDAAAAVLHTFTNPDPIPASVPLTYVEWTFTAGDGYQVDPNTTYHLKFTDAATSATDLQFYYVRGSQHPNEVSLFDPDVSTSGNSGWTIANQVRTRVGSSGTWDNTTNTQAMRFGIRGTVVTPGVTVDTDPDMADTQSDTLAVTEGMTDTYTVALDSAPSEQVTVTPTVPAGLSISPTSLTFSADDFGAKTFTVTAEHDMNLVSETGLSITHAVSGYGEITTADAVTVDVTEDDVAGITVDPTTLAVYEGRTATYRVVLDFEPAADVTANRGLTLSPTSLTFTTTNWETRQDVTVTAAEDTNNANETATITHTADESGSGTAYDLAASAIDSISVTVNDNDVITLSETALTIAEGMSGSYTVALARAPNPDSFVNMALILSADSGVTVDTDSMMAGDQHTLFFTSGNWSTAQTVTVTAPQDDDGFSNTGTIFHVLAAGSGLLRSATLTTAVTEDETVGLVLGGSATLPDGQTNYVMSVNENSNSGSSNQYTVQLASQPFPTNQNVTVTVTAPAGQANLKKTGQTTASKSVVLTFTGLNWNTAQTITVDAADDPDSAAATYSLTHSMSGANFTGSGPNLELTVIDLDTPGLVLPRAPFEIDETNAVVTETYTVKLATQPSANVTVTLTQPTNTDVTVSPGMLTFTNSNWNTERTVTVSIAADADAGNESATIVHSVSQTSGDMEYGAAQNRDVSVTIDDDEEPGVGGITATASMTEPASGTTTQTIRLSLDTPPTSPVTITTTVVAVTPAQVSGSDWTNPDITVTQSAQPRP